MPRRASLACLLSLLAIRLTGDTVDATLKKQIPSLLYTAAKVYEPLAWMHGGERFPSGASVLFSDAKGQRLLVPGFAASADPSISFSGERVIFAGKQNAGDPWQIWEQSLSGGKPRRISSGAEDCIRPVYLPDGRVVYARKRDGLFFLEAVSLSGGKPQALTYSAANSLPTDVLRDGRILFESEYASEKIIPEIYTVYSDGSGVESYRCDHGTARYSARQVSSGDIVFASEGGLAKFTSARARQIPVAVPAGQYSGEVSETGDGAWILSWRPTANVPFRIVLWTPGSTALESAITEPNANLIQPVLLAARTVPNRHPSGLHDWPNANLLCLNAYTSKYQFDAGSIHAVRFYTRDEHGKTRLLGTSTVELDGSFFVQVPGEQPLQVELIDSSGRTLKRETGFFWMKRGEQRGCVGCHAGPETAPENAVPMTLLKSTTPAEMLGASAQGAAGGH